MDTWSPEWLLSNEIALVAGAMIVNQIADYITELKLGNGTSILIFANIASYLPSSLGAAFAQASDSGSSSIAIYMVAFVLTTFGIVCVQVCPFCQRRASPTAKRATPCRMFCSGMNPADALCIESELQSQL